MGQRSAGGGGVCVCVGGGSKLSTIRSQGPVTSERHCSIFISFYKPIFILLSSQVSGCMSHSETIVTRSKAVTGNDLWRTYYVAPSQSPIELTLDNETLFKYRAFS